MAHNQELPELLSGYVERCIIPGAVAVLAAASGEAGEVVAAGSMSVDGPPMQPDAIMRIQSMTKPIVAVATLRLVEAGRLGLDDDVSRWLPELADRRVLRDPVGALADTEPANGPITVRQLLTNASGYGMPMAECPLLEAMSANQTAAGPEPVVLGADAWLERLAELPLSFHPGAGWRYHHSFGILGILLSRLTGRTLDDHLRDDVFAPLGMPDTGFWVPEHQVRRLPAAYRYHDGRLVETEPAAGGFYAGPPPFDVSHAELVSTIQDFRAFAQMLAADGRVPGDFAGAATTEYVSATSVQALRSDQVSARQKAPDSFFPGFWEGMGWGYGVGVQTGGGHRGRCGWSGGQGTDFYVDPDGTIGILLTQVELGEDLWPLVSAFGELPNRSAGG